MTTRRRRGTARSWQPYALVLAVVAATVVALVWPSSPRESDTTASAAGLSSAPATTPADGAANPSASLLASNKSDEHPLSATGWVLRPGHTVSV